MESEGEDCLRLKGGTKPARPDPATPGGADRVYRVHRLSRRHRGGEGEIQGGQVPGR